MTQLCLHHDNCSDGFMSGFLMYMYFKTINQPAVMKAVNYNQEIPDVSGFDVYIVDFSYPPEVLEEMTKSAKSITLLDHHLTAAEQHGGYRIYLQIINDCPMYIEIVEDKSGALLTYEYLLRKEKESDISLPFLHNPRLETLVKATSDRDLWNYYLPHTEVYHEMLQMVPKTFEDFEFVILKETEVDYQRRFERSFHYWEVKEDLAKLYAFKHQIISFQGYSVPITNTPSNFSSRVGELTNELYPFSIMYCLSTTRVFVSLRSRKGSGIDVSKIAAKFKGGGHSASAGLSLTIEQLPDLLNGKL